MKRKIRTGWVGLLVICAFAGTAWGQAKVVPPRLVAEPMWTFPAKAAQASLAEGSVEALLSVSDRGELTDFLILWASHSAFAEEIYRTLPECRFSPARVRGEPAATRQPVTFYFKAEGRLVSMSASAVVERQLARFDEDRHRITWVCPPEQLDRPLAPVQVVPPAYPDELRARGEAGSVKIDFYVDGEGRVRLPAVDAGAHPSFARMAISALQQWRFEAPTRGGRPVLVRVEQEFRFPSPPPET